MQKGLRGFQKGHKSFLTKEQYKQIGLKNRGKLKGHPQWNTGRTHFKKGVSNNVMGKNPMWKGGRWQRKDGYVLVKANGHPMARSQGYILEHRLKVSNYLGRMLSKTEVVHHKNGIKNDNRIINLELMDAGAHTSSHYKKTIFICENCLKKFNDSKSRNRRFCSKKCWTITRCIKSGKLPFGLPKVAINMAKDQRIGEIRHIILTSKTSSIIRK